MNPGVSVIACTYTVDRWPDLVRAVRSVLAQQPPVAEIVVVVDHNPELLSRAKACWPWRASAAATHRLPTIHVVPNTRARGLSGARNTGVEVAGSELVAFLDDDAIADVRWAERLVSAYVDDRVVACGGAVVPMLTGTRPRWWPLEFDWVVGCSYVGLPTCRAVVRNLIGANMSVRRAAILAIGGFADGVGRIGRLPAGDEETDLFIRLVQRWPQARVVYDPAALVRHSVPAERLSWRYFTSRCFAEGISKAKIAERVGTERALASERSYALKVLPRGIARGLFSAWRGEPGAARRAVAIGAGLTMTTAGYLRGRLAASVTRVATAI